MQTYLSKTKYLSYLRCQKLLWLQVYAPDEASPISEHQRRIFEQGKKMEIHARIGYPQGY